MISDSTHLYGRQIIFNQINRSLFDVTQLFKRNAITVNNNNIKCNRCGQISSKNISKLPNNNFYCPICINLGRISTLDYLCSIKEPNDFIKIKNPLTWQGNLTKAQSKCSKEIINSFKRHNSRLLWAVTGAGKTEMLFPGIEWGIKHNYRIAIASPRVDVCIELFPRIHAAFNNISISLLHGKQTKGYSYTQLTICTTHQLLRFYRAFDALIIDEVDAFPFADNDALHYAVKNAVKEKGSLIYLTATPRPDLLKNVRKKKLLISYLPLRYHGHLLPQIHNHIVPNWRQKMKKHKLPKMLIKMINHNLDIDQRFLLFVPHVLDLIPISKILSKYFNQNNWRTVHSTDNKRLEKVKLMRERKIQFLITTTILERGVTFPGIDVLILGADETIFTTSSLVQIAGRVGRNNDRPYGNVEFFSHSNAKNISNAKKQIHHLNHLGAKLKL